MTIAIAIAAAALLLSRLGEVGGASGSPACAEHSKGTQGGDELTGSGDQQLLRGFGGSDSLVGGGGADCLHAGGGSDDIRGGRGSDHIRGGRGSDDIRGGRGSDRIRGAGGADEIRARDANRDAIRCGLGWDRVFVDPQDLLLGSTHCEEVVEHPASEPPAQEDPPDPDPNPPPETTIESGPTGTIASPSASFTFAASEAGSAFECRLDSAAYETCSSPKEYTNLVAGSHTFLVRATDAAGSVDPSPAHRSFTVDRGGPTSSPEIPGSGPIVAQDLAVNPDPIPVWGAIWADDPVQSERNTRVQQNRYAGLAGSGDPNPTVDGFTTDTFRRFHVRENDRFAKDVEAGNTSERAQLGRISQTESFHIARLGDHTITYLSVRLQDSPPPAWGPSPGQSGESQILQYKPSGPGEHFILSLQETATGLFMRHNYLRSPETIWAVEGVPKGKWLRLALDIEWAEHGAITIWGDLDGELPLQFQQLSPRVPVRTMPSDGYPQTLSLGIYQDRSAPAIWRDYANIQVTRAPDSH